MWGLENAFVCNWGIKHATLWYNVGVSKVPIFVMEV